MEFVLFQNTDDLKQGEDVSIIKANSSGLRECQKQYSGVDTEVLALKFACDASFYYLYGAPLIHVYTDCISLEGIFNKPLGDIKNRRIRDMVEKLMGFTFEFHYVPAEKNHCSRAHGKSRNRSCYPGGEELGEQIWISLQNHFGFRRWFQKKHLLSN